MKKTFPFLLFFFITNILPAQSPAELAESLKSGFRGLSVVNENVMWMSGRKGLVGVTTSAGKKWKWTRVKGHEELDFRSLHAFDGKHAVIAGAGTPAVILETENGGKSWTQRFRSDDSAMFFDGMAFWDATHGLIYGDPVNGKMFLMETFDGGKTWKEIPFADRPQLKTGEASFAASGTTIRVLPGGHVWIATGGVVSRLWHSRDYGHHWEVRNTPILQGSASQGIFSVAFRDTMNGVIVGGDYTADSLATKNCFYTMDGGKTWMTPCMSPGGYRSCVAYVAGDMLIATGPSGTDISHDGGAHWENFAPRPGFNTIAVIPDHHVAYLGGGKQERLKRLSLRQN